MKQSNSSISHNQLKTLNKCLKKQDFIGTILFIQNNDILFSKSYGYSNYHLKIKNKTNTSYPIASLQKAITAALIMKSVKEHKLSLDDHLNKFYPKIIDSNKITIRELLNMTSGLATDKKFTIKDYTHYHSLINFDMEHLYFLGKIGVWNYQPVNYHLLTAILEKVNHHSYHYLVYQNIIKPLHLKHTGFIKNKSLMGSMISYYYKDKNHPYANPISNNCNFIMRKEYGTGDMISTPKDMYKIEKALVTGNLLGIKSTQQLYCINNHHIIYCAGLYPHIFKDKIYYTSYGRLKYYWSGVIISKNGKNALIMFSNRYNKWMHVRKLYEKLIFHS